MASTTPSATSTNSPAPAETESPSTAERRPGGSSFPRTNIPQLTGLRAFAASWVVLYHFRTDIENLIPTTSWMRAFFGAGYVGVDVFFVLSGFIICYTYLPDFGGVAKPKAYLRFFWLRLARMYPVHLATLAFFLLWNTPGGWRGANLAEIADRMRLWEFQQQVLLVHAWGAGETRSWNYPSWSISVEWFAYLLFPVAALGFARLKSHRSAGTAVLVALAFNVLSFWAVDLGGYGGEFPMVRIVGEFSAGACLFLLWRDGWHSEFPWARIATVAFVSGVAAASAIGIYGSAAAVISAPLFAISIVGMAYSFDGISRFFALPVLVFLGEASYSLYMTHAVSQRLLWDHLGTAGYSGDSLIVRAGVLVTYAAVIETVAIATYLAIEKPGRRVMRSVIDRRVVEATVAPPMESSVPQ